MCNWITLLYSSNEHNIVNQLYFNLKKMHAYNKEPARETEAGQSEKFKESEGD